MILEVLLGLFWSGFSLLIWKITPRSWFCEYGDEKGAQRMKEAYGLSRVWFATVLVLFLFWFCVEKDVGDFCGGSARMVEEWKDTVVFFLFLQIAIADAQYKVIPDQWSIGIGLVALFCPFEAVDMWKGAIVWGGGCFLLYWASLRFLRKIPFGMGDVKLVAALGLYFGVFGLAYLLMLSSLFCGAVSGLLLLTRKCKAEDSIAYGPFLASAGILILF